MTGALKLAPAKMEVNKLSTLCISIFVHDVDTAAFTVRAKLSLFSLPNAAKVLDILAHYDSDGPAAYDE